MCGQDCSALGSDPELPDKPSRNTSTTAPFPWHLPICDAHCHPVENMTTAAAISTMRARVLTVMGTRSQDQDLVVKLAASHPIDGRQDVITSTSSDDANTTTTTGVVPAFGWHPWFSFELYDDEEEATATYKPTKGSDDDEDLEAKKAHYKAVLQPDPSEDADFLASLPHPTPLSQYINDTRRRLAAHPHALVGEIGLDKAFRLPGAWTPSHHAARDPTRTPGGRERRRLSPYRVRMPHQQVVLRAQLRLAGEMGRPVSVHGVQAHGILYDTLASCWKGHEKEIISRRKRRLVTPNAEEQEEEESPAPEEQEESQSSTAPKGKEEKESFAAPPQQQPKPYPPRICLHSFSGTVEMARQYLHRSVPARIFFSFSTVVNLSTDSGRAKMTELVREVPDDRILVESDLHHAGERMDDMLEDMYREICDMKGWELEEGVDKIARNYQEFIFG